MALPISLNDLWEAWERVAANEGCAGSDGVTLHQFAHRAAALLERLLARVAEGVYRPFPLLKIVVEKHPQPEKKEHPETRTLLVPAVIDRVLQTAVAHYLSRSFEEEFLECSFGYRPHRSVDRAIARIRKCHQLGYRYVVDADIEKYFDRVDHDLLLRRLAERAPGELILDLLRQWVRGCIWDGSKIHPLLTGIPQGSPISPLLANFFLEDFDRELEKSGSKLVRYADDFIILSRTPAEAGKELEATRVLLHAQHLELNPEKTHVTTFDEGFRFLGAFFLGEHIWVPWKSERPAGRLLFVARPMPPGMRERFASAPPPRNAVETALERAAVSELVAHSPETVPEGEHAVAYLYLTEQGSVLRKAGDRFLVEKDDEVLLDLPYHKLDTVLLFGNIQVTTQALAELLEKSVNLSLFSQQGTYRGSLAPPRGKNVELRIAQFRCFEDRPRALGLARSLVDAKIRNGLAVLAHYREHNEAPPLFDQRRAEAESARSGLASASEVNQVDGLEGAAAKAYFECAMMFNKSGLEWPGRRKHPATDPLNALLSLGYTLLMHEITGLLEGLGLDPYLGFLHQVDYGRPSLALDLMEPFRNPVADRLVLNLVNRGMLDQSDFQPGPANAGLHLLHKSLKRFFGEYERWMTAKAGPGDAPAASFREALRAEAEGLAGHLRDGRGFQPFLWNTSAEQRSAPLCNTSSATT